MKEIIYDFSRQNARNAQHTQFATDALAAIPQDVAEARGFAAQRAAFAAAVANELECFQPDKGYLETSEIAAADRARDQLFYFYKQVIQAYADFQPDADKRKAGSTLAFAFREAGRVAEVDYASETALLTDLVEKLRQEPYVAALAAIGLADAPDELEAANTAFNTIYLKRSAAERDRDADTSAAAARCLEALGSQNPTTLPYTENTAAVRDIVDKLESDHYAPSVEQVGAAQLVADLKAANNDFDALYTARADERYARNTSAPDMKVARAAMEAAYADVADIVNALYIQSTVLAPDEETLAEVTAIATTVNALISQYTLVLSRRGVGKTTDDTTDTDTPDEGGTDTPQPEPEEPGGDEGEGGSPL